MSLIKTCPECEKTFEIFDQDLAFLERLSPVINGIIYSLPPPTRCPQCRMQRRLANRNERNLYHRKCDLTGKQIIASYSQDKPFPVYENDVWFSDRFDPHSYGREFDFNRPFFEQFAELRRAVPRMARIQQKPIENSDFCHGIGYSKNCYLMFSTNHSEDCYYGNFVNYSKNCVDNISIIRSELCYECIMCTDCYNLKYSKDCVNCKDSYFLRNCVGCRNCFGCTNLVNQEFYIFNEKKTEKEYWEFIKSANLGSYVARETIKKTVIPFLNHTFVRAYEGYNMENGVGNYLRNCKNAYMCFEISNSEDCSYCMRLEYSKDCMDFSHWGVDTELIYEAQACGYGVNRLTFCNLCWTNCSELIYCDHSFNSKNCFGSVGLKNARYVILNKQYSKAEYERLVPKIIEHMGKTEEWGEFFPIENSIYAYNESVSFDHWPVDKTAAQEKNWMWYEEAKNIHAEYQGPVIELPDNIKDAQDALTQNIFVSKQSGKLYKITPQELAFYRAHIIPLPRLAPEERHLARFRAMNPLKLWSRACAQCNTSIFTSYSPERPEQVLCESCYKQKVYG